MSWPEQPRSPVRVQISTGLGFAMDGIAVRMSLHYGTQDIMVGRIGEQGRMRFEPYDVGTLEDPGVTFIIPDEFARALLEEMLRHYQGASDMHTVRADLLHERGRVDKLLNAVTEMAQRIYPPRPGN